MYKRQVQDKFYLSLSAPRILNTERISVDESIATMATDKPHMYLSSGYRFELNPLWDLTPSFLMSKVENVPVLYDVNLLVSYNDMLDFGVTYRNAETFGATFSIDVSDSLTVGYSYETSSRTLLSTRYYCKSNVKPWCQRISLEYMNWVFFYSFDLIT